MGFTIVDNNWDHKFHEYSNLAQEESMIISPFLGVTTIMNLLGDNPRQAKVITRFNLDDMVQGASDIKAFEYFLQKDVLVKGIKRLHSKVYIFGANKVIVTSANLTRAGLCSNVECGVVSDDPQFLHSAINYFNNLWEHGEPLTVSKLASWKRRIANRLISGTGERKPPLGDDGADVGFQGSGAGFSSGSENISSRQAFVKFFGTGGDRSPRNWPVIEAIKEAQDHKVLSYPKNKRPRQERDGDLIFVARFVENPSDVMVYGRVRGRQHVPGRDDATAADIKLRPWRRKWSRYIRVSNSEFIKGRLEQCISLYSLIEELGPEVFITTYARSLRGEDNIAPQRAYSQQASVRLTPKAARILDERLDAAFLSLGKISESRLKKIV